MCENIHKINDNRGEIALKQIVYVRSKITSILALNQFVITHANVLTLALQKIIEKLFFVSIPAVFVVFAVRPDFRIMFSQFTWQQAAEYGIARIRCCGREDGEVIIFCH